MSSKRVQDSYAELIKYFNDINSDRLLKLIDPGSDLKKKDTSKSSKNDFVTLLYNFLYADATNQVSFDDIIDSMKKFNRPKYLDDDFCVTPFDGFGDTRVPYNISNFDTHQGSHNLDQKKYKRSSGSIYKISDFIKNKSIEESINKIHAIQVWSADLPPHGADAEISALFLNSISNIVMSRAVPYVDILVSTAVGDDSSLEDASFSLGRFFGKKEKFMQGIDIKSKFLDKSGLSVASQVVGKNKSLKPVSSMEIFTTPQTLVNADNVSYNELNPGRIDAFRPFLNLESFNVQVLPTGFGAISKKTADMQITLFDKGRLQDIAPLVSPLAYNTVQLDITYGWAHPSGNSTIGRIGSTNLDDKMGEFIDAMKVTDTFTVANSDYKFEKDGTVKINLKLVSTGMTKFTSETLDLSESLDNKDVMDISKIESALHALKVKLSGKTSKDIFLPVTILDGSFDGFISLDSDEISKIRKIIQNLSKSSKTLSDMAEVKSLLEVLIGTNQKKGKKDKTVDKGELGKFQASQMKAVQYYIDHLINTPDPFLPIGLEHGVTNKTMNENQYASLGKILMSAYGSFFQKNGEVMFIFGCFNENAAAVRDLNVSQFPIMLKGGSEKTVTLQSVLEKYYKTHKNITPEKFFQLIIDSFINVQSNEAYGLKGEFDQKDTTNTSKKSKSKKLAISEGGALVRENMITNKLLEIYETFNVKTGDPKFTLPKVAMSVDCRKTSTGEKNIIKVIIQDLAADPGKSTGEFLTDVLSTGFVLSPGKGSLNPHSPNHGKKLTNLIETLEKRKIISKMNESSFSKNKDIVKEILDRHESAYLLDEKFASNITKLRNEFYKDFPTLIVGSMGSGINDAQLSSQQNDQLKTIAVSQAINNKSDGNDPAIEYGMVLYPTQLTLEVFGSPVFKFMQRFFIDFGTNTSADNFYVITGINMNFSQGEFKCTLNMMVHDVFARTINIRKSAEAAMLAVSKTKKST